VPSLACLALLLLLPLAALAEAVELSLVSYNTHGLPAWAAGDDPEARFPQIAARLARYDVALIQEDFQHHELLAAPLDHEVVVRGNETRLPSHWLCLGYCSGSGLTFVARGAPLRWLAITSIPYGSCSGWFGGASDCFATKGYQHARLALPWGDVAHFVNTHLEAGRGSEDDVVRRSQLETLVRLVREQMAGEVVVLAGDLNLDWDEAGDREALVEFRDGLGLVDTGAERASAEAWERLDYVFVRDGIGTRVTFSDAREATEFVHGGLPLSDHPALAVRLRFEPVGALP